MGEKQRRWVKVPEPGQFRSEGDWTPFEDTGWPDDDWEWIVATGYMPTAVSPEKPQH